MILKQIEKSRFVKPPTNHKKFQKILPKPEASMLRGTWKTGNGNFIDDSQTAKMKSYCNFNQNLMGYKFVKSLSFFDSLTNS